MEEFTKYRNLNISSNRINLFTVVNCGSPEEMQTEIAIKIMMCFADKCGLNWKYGIGIGMGCLVNPEVFLPASFGGSAVHDSETSRVDSSV